MANTPTFVNKGAFASGTGNISPGLPSGIANEDILFLFVESENQTITAPSGWTEVSSSPQGTGTAGAAAAVRLGVFYKIVDGVETAPTVTDTGDHTTGIIMAFRGVDLTDPFDVMTGTVQASTTTSMVFPGVTTTVANTLIVHAVGLDRDAGSTTTIGTVTNANLTDIQERHDETVVSGDGGGIGVVTGIKASAGATGDSTATAAASQTYAYITMALQGSEPVVRTVGQYANDLDTVIGVEGNTDDGISNNIYLQAEYDSGTRETATTPKAEIDDISTSFSNTASSTLRSMKQTHSDTNSSRRGSVLVYDDVNKRYISFGGYDGTTRYSDVWERYVDKPGQPWRKLSPTGTPPSGRNLAGGCVVKGNLTSGGATRSYLIIWGGADPNDKNDMFSLRLDTPGSEAWTTITQTSAPSARSYMNGHLVSTPVSGASDQNYIYLFGGWAASRENSLFRCTFDVDSPSAVTWTTLKANGAGGNPTARSGAVMAYKASTEKLYLYGGYSGSAMLNDFWEYDIAGNSWTNTSPSGTAPTASEALAGGYDATNNRFWFTGGWTTNSLFSSSLNQIGYISNVGGSEAYNIVRANTLVDTNQAYAGNSFSGFCVDTDKGYLVLRGMATVDSNERYEYIIDFADTATSEFPVYGVSDGEYLTARDAMANVWNPDASEWVQIGGFSDMSDDSTIATGTHTSAVWVFNETNNTWRYANKGFKALPPGEGRVACYDTTRDRILVFGGLNGVGEVSNEVWSLTRDANGNYEAEPLRPTGTKPNPRWLAACVYDSANDRMIIALGGDGTTIQNNVHALGFSGGAQGAWTTLSPTGTLTNAVVAPGFAAKTSNTRLYIVGGSTVAGLGNSVNQTAYLDYSTTNCAWTTISTSGGTSRRSPSLDYDSTNDRLVAFGGFDSSNTINTLSFFDTSGTTWVNATTSVTPNIRRSHIAKFIDGDYYIHGGRPSTGLWSRETWKLTPNYGTPNSSTWTRMYSKAYNSVYHAFTGGTNNTGYHWQAWTTEGSIDSAKVSFGGNNEDESDFIIGELSSTTYTQTHTTDTLKRRQLIVSHTADANRKKAFSISHTTSSRLWRGKNHTTDALKTLGTSTAAPVFDASSLDQNGSRTTSSTWSHTVANQTNRLLVVTLTMDPNDTGSSVTFNGDSLTFLTGGTSTGAGNNTRNEIWYMLSPDIGTFDITANISGSGSVTNGGAAASYYNVSALDGSNYGGQTGNTSISISTTTSEGNCITIGGASLATDQRVSPGSGWNERRDASTASTGAGDGIWLVDQVFASSGSRNLDGTVNDRHWVSWASFKGVTVTNTREFRTSHTTDSYLQASAAQYEIDHTTDSYTHFNKLATLQDGFNSGSLSSQWEQIGAENATTDGVLNMSADASSDSGIRSVTSYDLYESSAKLELVSYTDGLFMFNTFPSFGNVFSWWSNGSNIRAYYQVGGEDSPTDYWDTYSPTTHRWLRVREESGTVYWDSSSDGVSWTNRFSATTPFDISAVKSVIYTYNFTGSPITTEVDNFNVSQPTASHTTDSLLRKQFTTSHSTDSNRKKSTSVSHTADANKKRAYSAYHTADSNKRKVSSLSHTTDSLLHSIATSYHTTDASLRDVQTVTHTTDAFLDSGERYWVGDGGDWSDTSHWAFTSGGASGAPVPDATKDVFFDDNSFSTTGQTVTVDIAASTKSLDWSGTTNNPTLDVLSVLSTYGTTVTFVGGMTIHNSLNNFSGAISIESAGSLVTLTTNGAIFNNIGYFGQSFTQATTDCELELADDVTITGDGYFWIDHLSGGSFNSNNHTINIDDNWGLVVYRYSDVDFGTSTLNVGSGPIFDYTYLLTGTESTGTFNVLDATINIDYPGTFFVAPSITIGTININTVMYNFYLYNNTVTDITFAPGTDSQFSRDSSLDGMVSEPFQLNILNSITVLGTNTDPIYIRNIPSLSGTQHTLSLPSGTVNGDYLIIEDSNATGGATWRAGEHSTNNGNNTGWIWTYSEEHSTDSLKRKVTTSSHTTDAHRRLAGITSHTTDALNRKLRTVSHTTDSHVTKSYTITHTTDALLHSTNTLAHTTDSNKRKETSVSHTTDSNKKRAYSVAHSTDANKKGFNEIEHTTDALLRERYPKDKAQNGSFEVGSGTTNNNFDVPYWAVTIPGNATVVSIDGDAAEGSQAIKIAVDATNSNNGIKSTSPMIVGAGNRYQLKLQAKSDVAGHIQIQLRDGSSGDYLQSDGVTWNNNPAYFTISTTTSYQQFLVTEFTTSSTGELYISDLKRSGGSSQANKNFFIDDIQVLSVTSHNTDALLRHAVTTSHTTDSFKRVASSLTHTTDSNKRKVTTSVHTTDSLKRTLNLRDHTTDSLLRETNIISHSTDSLLYDVVDITHTTDSNKRKALSVYHSTDSNKRKTLSVVHTTDALNRTESTRTHTTDALLREQIEKSYTTDALKRTTSAVTHTADTNKRKVSSVSHATDSNRRKENTLTHTTDSLLRDTNTIVHTADSLLRRILSIIHTTDSNKRRAESVSHTTDANSRKATTVTHVTDANKRKETIVSHTTDSLKRDIETIDHSTDALLKTRSLVSHATDANKRKGMVVYHTTSSYLRGANSVDHTTDSNKKKTGNTVYHSTDANKKVSGIVVSHSTDTNKKRSGNIVSHLSDALKRKTNAVSHATDALKRKVTQVVHTTDAFLHIENEIDHTTDSNLKKSQTRSHSTNSFLRGANQVVHSTDANKNRSHELSHTTDTFKTISSAVVHTTSANKRKSNITTHTTSSVKRAVAIVSHTTDAFKKLRYTISHLTDAFLRKRRLVAHTTSSNKKRSYVITHTTDAFLFSANQVTHNTDAYLSVIRGRKKVLIDGEWKTAIVRVLVDGEWVAKEVYIYNGSDWVLIY